MENYETQLKKRTLLAQASDNTTQARKKFNETQFEVNKERITSAEKAGWWAGAAVSLSFTLVGYIISNDELRSFLGIEIFYNFPLVYLLIIGSITFLISIIGSVLCRLFNSSYLNYNQANYWASSEKEIRALQLDWIINGYDFLPSGNETKEQALKNIDESKKSYEDLELTAKRRQNFNLKLVNYSIAATFVGVLVGFISLTLFLIIIIFNTSLL